MEEREVAETLRKELLDDYSNQLDKNKKLSKRDKDRDLEAVSKFLVHLVTEEGVKETLEIIQ